MNSKKSLIASVMLAAMALLSSCGSSQKSLVVPRSVSTVESVPVEALNLGKGNYEILQTVTETASVIAEYAGDKIRIKDSNGEFTYTFKFDSNKGWNLDKFSGIANFGFLLSDVQNNAESLPDAEEFARRVAIARLIEQVKDYGADGVIAPIVSTKATNAGGKSVEYQATVSAKIVKIYSTVK